MSQSREPAVSCPWQEAKSHGNRGVENQQREESKAFQNDSLMLQTRVIPVMFLPVLTL